MSKYRRCALLFLAGWMLLLSACSGKASTQATPTPLPPIKNYENAIFTVEQGPIESDKDLMGEVVPSKQDELFFRASGFINRVVVKEGDKVKKGDLLAEIQVDDQMNQLQQARIDLEVAQANLAKDKAQQALDLSKSKAQVVILEKQVELAQIDVDHSYGVDKEKAQINLEITQQNLALAKEDLQSRTDNQDATYEEQAVKRSELAVTRLEELVAERQIVAPYDAIILHSSARAGTQVEAFTTVFTIGDPANLVIRTGVDAELNGQLDKTTAIKMKLGLQAKETYPVEFLPNFLPSTTIKKTEDSSTSSTSGSSSGSSTDIFTPFNTTSTADYFYFTLPKTVPADQLPVGRSVVLTIVLGKKDKALLLSPSAVREYKGLNFVVVVDGDKRRRVEISKIGLKTTDKWEVVADLKPGDKVLGP